MRKKILYLSLLLLIGLSSCDLFIKKNPNELFNNKSDYIVYNYNFKIPTSATINLMLISSDNKNLYIADANNHINSFAINENGNISFLQEILNAGDPIPDNIQYMVITPDGRYIYTAASSATNINIFKRNKSGYLEFIESKAMTESCYKILVTFDNRNLYLLTNSPYNFYCMEIQSNGTLKEKSNGAFSNDPFFTIPSYDGLYLYSFDVGVCNIFKRNYNNGNLSFMASYNYTSSINPSITMSKDQRSIYNIESNEPASIMKFKRNITNGLITGEDVLINKSSSQIALSNDDKKIYSIYNSDFSCIDIESKKAVFNFTSPFSPTLNYIVVSPNDKFIYANDTTGNIFCFERIIK